MALAHQPLAELQQQRHLVGAGRAREPEAERRVVGPLGRRLRQYLHRGEAVLEQQRGEETLHGALTAVALPRGLHEPVVLEERDQLVHAPAVAHGQGEGVDQPRHVHRCLRGGGVHRLRGHNTAAPPAPCTELRCRRSEIPGLASQHQHQQ